MNEQEKLEQEVAQEVENVLNFFEEPDEFLNPDLYEIQQWQGLESEKQLYWLQKSIIRVLRGHEVPNRMAKDYAARNGHKILEMMRKRDK